MRGDAWRYGQGPSAMDAPMDLMQYCGKRKACLERGGDLTARPWSGVGRCSASSCT